MEIPLALTTRFKWSAKHESRVLCVMNDGIAQDQYKKLVELVDENGIDDAVDVLDTIINRAAEPMKRNNTSLIKRLLNNPVGGIKIVMKANT